jgi:hypothetical protein
MWHQIFSLKARILDKTGGLFFKIDWRRVHHSQGHRQQPIESVPSPDNPLAAVAMCILVPTTN